MSEQGVAYGFFINPNLSKDEILDALLSRETANHIPFLQFNIYDLNGESKESSVPQDLVRKARNGGMELMMQANLCNTDNYVVAQHLSVLLGEVIGPTNRGVYYLGSDGHYHYI